MVCRHLTTVLFVLFACAACRAVDPTATTTDGPVTATISANVAETQVAQPIELRIQVDAPTGYRVTFPPLDGAVSPFMVADESVVTDLPVDEPSSLRRSVLTAHVEAFETGELTVPSIEIAYKISDSLAKTGLVGGSARTIRTKPITIQLISVLQPDEQPADFRDIKQPQPTPASPNTTNRWGIPAIIATGLLGCCWFLWRRRQGPDMKSWALNQVQQIERSNSLDQQQTCAQLSAVLRQYLQAQMDLPVTSLSSEELLKQLSQTNCPSDTQQKVNEFFASADRLRFAGNHDNDSMDNAFPAARAIIENVQASTFREER